MRNNIEYIISKRTKKTVLLFSIIVLFNCVACTTILGPNIIDLKFESISAIDYNIVRQEYAFGGTERPNLIILKINFTTEKELGSIGIANQLILSYKAYNCSNKALELDKWPYIYLDKFRINQLRDKDKIQQYKSITDRANKIRYVYTIFVLPINSDNNLWEYSEITNPFDICIEVSGHGYGIINGFKSNTFIIPKEIIKNAIDKKRKGS